MDISFVLLTVWAVACLPETGCSEIACFEDASAAFDSGLADGLSSALTSDFNAYELTGLVALFFTWRSFCC